MPRRLSALTVVSVRWLLNSAIGARGALREGLPTEWVADLYIGRDAPAEFFKGGGYGAVARTPHDGYAGTVYGAKHARW